MSHVPIFEFMQVLAGLVTFLTMWGWLPFDHWWIRGVDFPRIQILFLGVIAWFAMLLFFPQWQMPQWGLMLLLSMALAFQLRMILPYTKLWKKEVKTAKAKSDQHRLTLMVSNVLTPNKNTQALIDLITQHQPDILIALETDHYWQQKLAVIEADYPHSVKVPQDNLYGMHLYSKLPLIDPTVKYLMIDDIPSIHTQVQLKTGELVWLYCLHPMPPSPTEAQKSTTRDAELLLVGKHIKQQQQPTILAGDLNDVAWSKTTRMFQRISGLLDPRIGRYFINTFHVDYPFLRWALDHLFHSPCFTLVSIHRLPSIGSDHFPVLTTLQYEPESQHQQAKNQLVASQDDLQEAKETIKEGKIEGKQMSQ